MLHPHTQASEGRGRAGGPMSAAYIPNLFIGGVPVESLDIISQVISQLGFPVAMCIILFYSLNQERKDHKASEETITSSIVELKETFTITIHGQQEKMVEAINNNTLVMQRLVDKLDGGQNVNR